MELETLKKALGIRKGSIQYKKREILMLTRIYRWWLSGYPSEILEEMLKSAKEGSLKERLIKEILEGDYPLEPMPDVQNFGKRADPMLVRKSSSNENLTLEEKNEALELG